LNPTSGTSDDSDNITLAATNPSDSPTPGPTEYQIEKSKKDKKKRDKIWQDKIKKKMFPYQPTPNAGGSTNSIGHSPGTGSGTPHSIAELGLEQAESGHADNLNVGQANVEAAATGGVSTAAAAAAAEAAKGWGSIDMNGWGFPIVLDLGGDGIEIVPLGQSRAKFDISGDGRRQFLAWVGPDDALLVYDRDGDRVISNRDEIAFKDYLANAKTDLEGLAWFDQFAQGGNEDGVLDERDALWSKFGVWRDADQDGETDPGELRMTGEGGLSSVNLQSDNVRRDGGPDAQIFGRGQFVIRDTDGNALSGDFYDTALRYLEDAYEPPAPKRMQRLRKDGEPLSRAEIMYPAHDNDDDYYMVEAAPLPEDPAKTLANALYPPKKPEAKRVRLGRKDGQPISPSENLYPGGYPDADYVVVEIPPGKSRR